MKKAQQAQLRMSRIARISIQETDAMDIMEEREFINILVSDLEEEKQEMEKLKNK